MCSAPVGLGAKRTLTFLSFIIVCVMFYRVSMMSKKWLFMCVLTAKLTNKSRKSTLFVSFYSANQFFFVFSHLKANLL